jgi:hypothetical protein
MSRSNWIEPAYSRAQVDRAARVLLDPDTSHAVFKEELDKFVNWRAAHGYPLNTAQIVLRSRARKVTKRGLVSQRHKREVSIVRKLTRSRSMRLTQMQDIAGCRAIVPTIRQVLELQKHYSADIRNDYISCPAESGYRSIHAVSVYQGKKKTSFDGLLVEVQLRTSLQHAWATAVETVDTFTGSDLKSGYGDQEWRRLFALVGTVFALDEQCPSVPGTTSSRSNAIRELRSLENELGLLGRLHTWHRASQVVRNPSFRFQKYLLIEQWPTNGKIRLHTFASDEYERATEVYSELEQKVTAENRLQVVMASADSLSALRRAYPNLFVDPTQFLIAYQAALS